MKKVLTTIVTLAFVISCSAESNIRIPLFGKRNKRNRVPRCEWKDELKRNRRQRIAAVTATIVPFVVLGLISDNNP